ncbi:MAG: hypothetical protein JJ866_06325 [Roseibium sp.]|uniref:hypothetical protein n=1 Tax=Roseibium sp. TaxID=1936156 RepID=UPI001B0D2663|nr:hypothetical protein [Roseibium sp.]MBO6891538.1 hypothetical protein [Roseibium sp.]MBO6931038.1 hypothetical protein [Roseibium sp.]
MRLFVVGVLILLSAFAASAKIIAPQIFVAPRTEFRKSENWTLRISQSIKHDNVIVLSALGSTADSEKQSVSLVYYCMEKDFFSVSFLVLPDEDRFKLLVDQDARYQLRDDMEQKMPVTPVGGFADEYETYLDHLEPSVGNANLVMIKYPGFANSLLYNSRKGGDLQVSMKDRNEIEFDLLFDVDGLAELHDAVRKKCGW